MEQKQVLVTIPMTEEQRGRLERLWPQAAYTYAPAAMVTEQQAQQAEVILGSVPAKYLHGSERLCWMHLNSAGYDAYVKDGVLHKNTVLTNSTGAYGKAVSEHMFAMLLAMMKKLHLYRDNQKRHAWADEGGVGSITDATVLVLGAGDIGTHFAALAHGMGAYVIGVKRSPGECPSCMDELHTVSKLRELLPRADAVVSFLPSSEETRGMFNRELFCLMKKGSFFVNGGRGDLVCQEDLCDALEAGQLAGAALDVTNPEPLPEGHRLWGMDSVFITPHASGGYHLPETLRNVVEICLENVRRYAGGEDLRNVVKH